jgi:quinol monooxygenase YgiN
VGDVVVVATFHVDPERVEEFLTLLERVTTATHAEEGCLKYACVRATDEPGRLAIVERWRSAADLGAHSRSAHIAEFRAAIEELQIERPDVTVYEELGLGSEAQGTV